MAAILFVRIKSALSAVEAEWRIEERLPRFRDVPGLVQKLFGRDPETGDICGIYFFEDEAALAAYRESDLAKSIPDAYDATAVRREVYELIRPLHPERDSLPA